MSTKKTKKAQNMIKTMSASKKKLHEMVESLINGDSKAAAASLHDYLQVKTRTVLGETDEEGDDEMVADRHDDESEGDGEGSEGGHEHDETCSDDCDMGEESSEEGEGDEGGEGEFDAEAEFGGEGEGEGEEEHMHEANLTQARGNHFEKNTAKLLDRKVKGTLNYDKTSASGTKKSTSGMKPTSMKKNSMGTKDLTSTVKGKIKFDKSSGTKSDTSGAKKTKNNMLPSSAKGLESKVKGNVKFSSSKARTNNV